MLVCRTCLGRVLVHDQDYVDVPRLVKHVRSGSYDAVCGDRWRARGTFREFIVRSPEAVYPAWVVYYKRHYESS